MTKRRRSNLPAQICSFCSVLATLLAVGGANAQGFMVLPMRMEVEARVGQALEFPLEIRNTVGEGSRVVELRVVELTQTPAGAWQIVEPTAEIPRSPHSSVPWTTLSTDRLEVAPLQPATVIVQVRPPAAAKGVFFAGIVAEPPPRQNGTGIAVRARFLIPLIIQIQGRPVRQQIVLDEVTMTYEAPEGEIPTTTAFLEVANRGQTFSRVRGKLQIERQSDDKWRLVTRVDLPERAILPGHELALANNLDRRLPSGKYRLRGDLFVDGRRVAPVEREIAFIGDPKASTAAYDTALKMTPAFLEMDVSPGATRTTVVNVENPGTVALAVQFKAATPRSLAGTSVAGRKGTALSAEPWIEVRPAEFTIPAGRKQNIRVISRVPREGLDHPHYYADLILQGHYADGQSAGNTRSTIHLAYPEVQSTPDGVIDQVSIAEGELPNKYVLQMRFANLGNTHLELSALAALIAPQGGMAKTSALAGEEGSLLPFGTRSYSGELDFADVPSGTYALRFTAALTTGREFAHQQVVLVSTEEIVAPDGAKLSVRRVAVVEPDPDAIVPPAAESPIAPPDEGIKTVEPAQ